MSKVVPKENNDPPEWPLPEISKETRIVKATILAATYHPDEKCLIIRVKMEDGSRRALPIPASVFKYHGKPFKETAKEVVDNEMFRTEALFRKAAEKHRRINLKLFSEQLDLTGL